MTAHPLPLAPQNPVPGVAHEEIEIVTSRPFELVDLTSRVAEFVRRAGLAAGLVSVQTLHTTTAVVLNEHEPLLWADVEERLGRFAPAKARWRHDDLRLRTVERFGKGAPLDPWGRPYRYGKHADGLGFELSSDGADGSPSDDDVR